MMRTHRPTSYKVDVYRSIDQIFSGLITLDWPVFLTKLEGRGKMELACSNPMSGTKCVFKNVDY